MRNRFKKGWKWVKINLLNKEVLIFTLIGETIFWSPIWISAILALVHDPWWWTVAGGAITFWSGPFTPAILLQLALIFALKILFGSKGKLRDKIKIIKDKASEILKGGKNRDNS